jgi:hypothetical protein
MPIDLKDLGNQLLPILKDGVSDLWDGPEDTEFLKLIAQDIAKLTAQKVAGDATADGEIAILAEAVRQKAMQKTIRLNGVGEKVFHKIISIVGKLALAMI